MFEGRGGVKESGRAWGKSERRRSKAEGRPKSEVRNRCDGGQACGSGGDLGIQFEPPDVGCHAGWGMT